MFKRLFSRLRQDADDLRSGSIREWAERQSGATPIAEVEARSVAKVAGMVEVLRVRPREGMQAFEADVTDGTGTVTAVWLGRPTVPGVAIGVRIILEGRMGGTQPNLVVMNPAFEFAAGEH